MSEAGAGLPPGWEDCLERLLMHIRRYNGLVVVAAFTTYGLAYWTWTLGQTLGAAVVATLGYLLFRSMRKISFNLAWQSARRILGDPPGRGDSRSHPTIE